MKEKEFVPYDLALRLKALGFDEPCLAWFVSEEHGLEFGAVVKSDLIKEGLLAPTWQSAFRWFREEYKYDTIVTPSGDSNGNTIGYYYEIIFQGWDDGIESDSYSTYEEAELECLVKLIEIVENI